MASQPTRLCSSDLLLSVIFVLYCCHIKCIALSASRAVATVFECALIVLRLPTTFVSRQVSQRGGQGCLAALLGLSPICQSRAWW